MEIYKDLNNPDNQKFEELLNSQLSKKACFLKIKKIIDKKLKLNGNL